MHKIALLGAGRIGRIHAANALAHRMLRLEYVVDPLTANAAAVADETGAAVTTLETVLADAEVEGVIVASSTDTHLDYTLAAHRAGKAVFCEKPVDQSHSRAASAAAELASGRVFIGFNRRFDPNFRALQQQLEDRALGGLETLQITSNDPGPPPVEYIKLSGGLFKDMSIHDFDAARWLLGEEPEAVFAWGSSLVDPAIAEAGDIDTARIMLKTATGKLCVIANSRRSGFGYDQRIEAYCAKGMVRADNVTETTMQVWSEEGAASDRFQNFFLDRYAAAYRAEMAHFAEILEGVARPQVAFWDGVAALALAEAAAESMATGSPVRL